MFIACALAAPLGACEDISDKDEDEDEVLYEISCGDVTCNEPTDESFFESGGSTAIDCTWYCVEYEGEDRYVALTFWSWDGECYEEPDVYTSDCI